MIRQGWCQRKHGKPQGGAVDSAIPPCQAVLWGYYLRQ